jgi:hypothetical protein
MAETSSSSAVDPKALIARIQQATKAYRPQQAWAKGMSSEEMANVPTVPARPKPLDGEGDAKEIKEKKKGRPKKNAATELVTQEDRDAIKKGLREVLEAVLVANVRTSRMQALVRERVAGWKRSGPASPTDADLASLMQEVVKVSLDVAVDTWTPVMLDKVKVKARPKPKPRTKKRAEVEGGGATEKKQKPARRKKPVAADNEEVQEGKETATTATVASGPSPAPAPVLPVHIPMPMPISLLPGPDPENDASDDGVDDGALDWLTEDY